jgi:hypothetical protein
VSVDRCQFQLDVGLPSRGGLPYSGPVLQFEDHWVCLSSSSNSNSGDLMPVDLKRVGPYLVEPMWDVPSRWAELPNSGVLQLKADRWHLVAEAAGHHRCAGAVLDACRHLLQLATIHRTRKDD